MNRLESQTGAPRFERPADLAKECDLLIVAVTDALSEHIVPQLMELGVPLLCETPLAWTADGVRQVLSHRQCKLGVAEQFPFMPLEQLRQKIIPLLGDITTVINDGSSYSYHGIAQMRRYISGAPLYAKSDTVTFDSGQTLVHRAYSASPSFRIIGTQGMMIGETLVLGNETFEVVREADGSLSLAGERWHNPYPNLSDEQVGVATIIEAMKETPLYSGEDFLADIEIVQALRYAEFGQRVPLPLNARLAKLKAATSPAFWVRKLAR